MHCASLLRTIFASLAHANECALAQNVRDSHQTKLDSEINACFLLNEHGDPHFLFYKFNENNVLNNWEKNWQKSMATFLANEINATDRDVMGPAEQVQIMFLLRIKILINNARYLKPFFLGRRWINNQRKSLENNCAYLLRTKITKSHLNNRIWQHCGMKTSTVTPSFYYVFNISLSCNINIPSFIGNVWRVFLLGNHLKSAFKPSGSSVWRSSPDLQFQ